MKTLIVANNKGGCGKTTTAYHLGKLMAGSRLRVLLVDLDPQANLSSRFPANWDNTINDVLGGATQARCAPQDACIEVGFEGDLHLMPSSDELANVALGLLHDVIVGRMALKRALRQVHDRFDLAIVDCPPEAGILLANALFAADGILLAAEPEEDALAGAVRVAQMAATVREDRERETPAVLGLVATRIDKRTTLHSAGLAYVMQNAEIFGPLLGQIPERNGQLRNQELTLAYAEVANHVDTWMQGGGADAKPPR